MAGTAADAIAGIAERMLKEKDARIAELEMTLRAVLDYVEALRPIVDPIEGYKLHQLRPIADMLPVWRETLAQQPPDPSPNPKSHPEPAPELKP